MLRGLSLFANIGVAEARLVDLDVDICLANEIEPKRAAIYEHLYPRTTMVCGDITKKKIRNKIISLAKELDVNFVMATPPCQGMSVAGNRNPIDARNQLIYYAIEIIKQLSPDFILLENVPRQLKTHILVEQKTMLIPEYIERELGDSYAFNDQKLINAKYYKVPQNRERNIYLGSKKTQNVRWQTPKPDADVISLREAIGDLPSLDPILREGMELTKAKFPRFDEKVKNAALVSKWHKPPKHPWRHVEWMTHTPTGTSAIFNKIYFPQKNDGTPIHGHHNHYRRLDWDNPCRVVTMFNSYISTLSSVHPGTLISSKNFNLYSDARALSIYELMIVMTIPITWPIPININEPLFRSTVGEGIPPLLVEALFRELLEKF